MDSGERDVTLSTSVSTPVRGGSQRMSPRRLRERLPQRGGCSRGPSPALRRESHPINAPVTLPALGSLRAHCAPSRVRWRFSGRLRLVSHLLPKHTVLSVRARFPRGRGAARGFSGGWRLGWAPAKLTQMPRPAGRARARAAAGATPASNPRARPQSQRGGRSVSAPTKCPECSES